MDARKIDGDVKVTMGRMIAVENQLRSASENASYVAIHVENEDGKGERCLLFTETELSDMEKVTIPFAFESMKKGRIYPVAIGRHPTNLVKIENRMGTEMILRMSETQLKRAERRASRNPEDLPKKGFLTDLLD